MRRLASLAGVSLIAGGATALVLFASSARAQLPSLPLTTPNNGAVIQQAGSGDTTTTTAEGTTTTMGGSGSGNTTTTAAGGTTTTAAGGTTTTTAAGGTTTTTAAGAATTTTTAASNPTVASSRQSVAPGESTVLTGNGWPPNTDLTITMSGSDPVNLGTARSDGNGAFSATVTIPSNTSEGSHTITVSGGGRSASTTLLVSGGLSRTGLSWNLAILGLAMVAAGIIMLAGDRIGKQDLIEFA